MRCISLTLLFASLVNSGISQTVTLKQIGKETVLFSDVFAVAFNQNLYTIENTGAIYKTSLLTGAHTRLGNATFKSLTNMFILNDQLYCIELDGSMNRIDINTGAWAVVSSIGTWKDVDGILTVANKFYTTKNGVLYYHPTMNENVKKQVGGEDFYDLGNWNTNDTLLCTLIGGTLYQIDLQSWKWKKIGANKGWRSAKDGDIVGNKFYTIETPSSLYETDFSTGSRKLLDDKQFQNAWLIYSDLGKLYTIFKDGQLFEINIAY